MKVSRPDDIPPEGIKRLVQDHTDICLTVLNNILVTDEFPEEWKVSKLVLIKKQNPGKRAMDIYWVYSNSTFILETHTRA